MNFNNEFAAPLISIRRAPQNDCRVLSLSLIEDFSFLITQAAAQVASIDLKNGPFLLAVTQELPDRVEMQSVVIFFHCQVPRLRLDLL